MSSSCLLADRSVPSPARHRTKQLGFNLIEVLVTIVLLSIGLLGLAALQATSLKSSHGSYYRSIASQQAYDMADRIAANLAGVTAGRYDDLDSSIPNSPPDCISSACGEANMALFDAYQWLKTNQAVLPGGSGRVCIIDPTNLKAGGDCEDPDAACVDNAGAAPRRFRIMVSWTERTEGNNVTQCFFTQFMP